MTPSMTLIPSPGPGKAENQAVRETSGKILGFIRPYLLFVSIDGSNFWCPPTGVSITLPRQDTQDFFRFMGDVFSCVIRFNRISDEQGMPEIIPGQHGLDKRKCHEYDLYQIIIRIAQLPPPPPL